LESTLRRFGSSALRFLELTPGIITARAEKVEKPARPSSAFAAAFLTTSTSFPRSFSPRKRRAGIQFESTTPAEVRKMDSRFRGNDVLTGEWVLFRWRYDAAPSSLLLLDS